MPTSAAVLTDVPSKPGRFWGDHTQFVGPARPPAWLARALGRRWADRLAGVATALRLFARRRHCRGVVTGGGPGGLVFAWLQRLVPWGRKPHVLVDCIWYLSASGLANRLRALCLRGAAPAVHRFVVWASHEVEDYARAFGLPPEQLAYVPFHDTLHDYPCDARDGDYLFAGGNYDRDYATLVEAVRPLDVPTWIATTRPELLAGVDLPAHVRVEGTTAAGFRQALAGARLVVVPMQGDLLHSGGQQTLLNAMLLGKPTVAVGRRWAADLMEDGVHGLVVDYADPEGLRRAVRWILAHPEEARRLAGRGRAHAARFTTQRCMQTVYKLVAGAPPSPQAVRPGPAALGA